MYKQRLLKLADLLDADAKRRRGICFDIMSWGTVSNPAKPLSCGTSACAMGLAALSGEFRRQGLTAKIRNGDILFKMNGRVTNDGFMAAVKLFGISSQQASDLFGIYQRLPDSGIGAEAERAVAANIRQFVAANG